MSDYGVFEASTTDGHEEEQQQRQAQRDLGRAIEAAREGFGDFLAGATDKDDYTDRLALIMNDLMQKVADSGVMPVPGVMRKVKAALRPEFRTAGGFSDGVAFEEAQSVVWDLASSGVELRSWDQVVSKFPDSLRDQAEANKEDIIDILRSKGVWKDASRKQAEDLSSLSDEELDARLTHDPRPDPNVDLSTLTDEELDARINYWSERDVRERNSSRKQASVEDLRSYVESKGLTTSDKDNGFTFPTADGAKGHVYENRAGDIVVQTLIGGSGGGVQSNYSQDETELVKEWIDRTASRKQALQWDRNDGESASFSSTDSGLDYWIKNIDGQWEWSIFDFLSGESDQGTAFDFYEAESYIEDFIANSDPEDAFNQLGSRKVADDYVKGDALNFINHLQNGGYRMPKDAGYPGEGGQMDDELYDYTNGDQNRISEITRFLQENWDFYAYGASRKQASDVNTEDQAVLQFFYQFEDEGLDVSASGDEQWEWLKSNIDYDTLQDAIDQANEYGELGASQADALAYDLQQNFFGSRTAGAGNWSQTHDGSNEWVLNGNPQISIFEEEDGYYLFNNISLIEVTDTFEQAMELAESRYEGSLREAGNLGEVLEDHDVLGFFWDTFEEKGLDTTPSGAEQWEWLKSNLSKEEIEEGIDFILGVGGFISQEQADALRSDLRTGSRKVALDWSSVQEKVEQSGWDPMYADYIAWALDNGKNVEDTYSFVDYSDLLGLDAEDEQLLKKFIQNTAPRLYGSRKEALDIDGSWEEELPGIGYASCTPKAGGSFELYMWSDSKQSEALDIVPSSEEARRIWKEWRRSDIGPSNAFNTDDNYFL